MLEHIPIAADHSCIATFGQISKASACNQTHIADANYSNVMQGPYPIFSTRAPLGVAFSGPYVYIHIGSMLRDPFYAFDLTLQVSGGREGASPRMGKHRDERGDSPVSSPVCPSFPKIWGTPQTRFLSLRQTKRHSDNISSF